MNIRPRLTIYFTLLVMGIVLAGSMATYLTLFRYTEQAFYDRLYAKAITTALRRIELLNIDSGMLATIDKYQLDVLPAENITVYDSADRNIYTNNDTIYYKESKELFDKIREKHFISYTEGPYKIIALTYNSRGNRYIISAGAEDRSRMALLKELRWVLLLIFIISMILTVLAGWFFVGNSLAPLSSILAKVRSLSPVEQSERLPLLSEKDEIGLLIKTFNELFDKLEDAFRLQKNFTSNVSHELNNPLTKIKSQLEVSLIQNREGDSYRETMQSVLEDVNELIGLIEDFLNFSRLTSDPDIAPQLFRIDEILFEIRDHLLAQFPLYNIIINIPVMPESATQLMINCNNKLMSAAIRNIVENACKFSVSHTAYINLIITDGAISVTIDDDGPGIAKSDLTSIFEPFYRSAISKDMKGYGIGLALAQRIIKSHGLLLEVESVIGVGTRFTIRFSN